ncbi:hypothetical protein DIPPA_01122 [Diplonema papillatum]|nr:hypothetical protein DIPPA_23069 [Diplonema papillatum]KAJ9449674.1 hypothetical protein DIPPA_01122 [Diplonema papillatum]
MATDGKLAVGTYVQVVGLQNAPHYNGQHGFVVNDNGEKVEVALPKALICCAPAKLAAKTQDTRSKKHEIAMFFAGAKGLVNVAAVDGWPTEWEREKPFLAEKFKWGNPQILGGIERAGMPKPSFMMYYDAADTTSSVNNIAESVAALLPSYELGKVPAPAGGKYRGACILVYSPMVGYANGGTPYKQESADTRWSLDDFSTVLAWHASGDADAQYKAHDDPMHRVFGGLTS